MIGPDSTDRRSAVVVAGLQDHDVVPFDEVDEPVFLVDAPRPGSSECVTELLGFPDPGEGIPANIIEQAIDAPNRRRVR